MIRQLIRRHTLILAAVLVLLSGQFTICGAIWVHYFECNTCHTAANLIYDLDNNVCQTCHNPTDLGSTRTLRGGSGESAPIVGPFVGGDASNKLGSVGPVYNSARQTSHNFAAPDTNIAAGALPAADNRMYSRYQIGRGQLYCARCHLPHDDKATNPQLLRTGAGSAAQMCLDCHRPWNLSGNRGLDSHPLVTDYNSVALARPADFATTPVNTGAGTIGKVNGGVSCTSCHGIHFTDSDATTPDGKANHAGLSVSDGSLLKSDGPARTGATNAETAQLRSNLCQSCHQYAVHGSAGEQLGCLTCHSAHTPGSSNYFMLREQVTTSAFGTANLAYTQLPLHQGGTQPVGTVWADGNVGTNGGYCESCHGDLQSMPGSLRSHTEGELCSVCHGHNKANTTRSFEGAGCDECHGYPPRTTNQGGPDGYAFDSGNGYDYSAQPFYKPENLTPHSSHAGAGSGYEFPCSHCHNDNSPSVHDSGSFQSVFVGAGFDPLVDAGGTLSPAYATGGDGTCSAIACHSNGGPRTGDGPTRSYLNTPVTWGGQKGSIIGQPGECSSCHGNDAATMGGAQKNNSASHLPHLSAGFSCSLCHIQTADNATTLATGAVGGSHVNGTIDVAFDISGFLSVGTTPFDPPTGVCSVYCHSDGNGTFRSPDWDNSGTASCILCHNHDISSGSPMATGTHDAHINDADNEIGRNLGCVNCHSNTVSDNSTIATPANHPNGIKTIGIAIDGGQTSCASISCHSNGNYNGSLQYKVAGVDFTWGGASLSGCDDCHGDGAGTIAPAYPDGGIGGNANTHPQHLARGYNCQECHSDTAEGSLLKSTGTATHVNGFIDVVGTRIGGFAGGSCSTVACHFGKSPTWGDTLNGCTGCHNNGTDDGQLQNAAPSSGAHATHVGNGILANAFINDCESCHGSGANTGTHTGHINFTPNLTGSISSYNAGNQNCTNVCHDAPRTGMWTLSGTISCADCHRNGFIGPVVVWPDGNAAGKMTTYGSHLKAATGDTLTNGTDWADQCARCHPANHSSSTVVPLPGAWNSRSDGSGTVYNAVQFQDRLGIDYRITGAIHLGGSVASGATEAEVCWSCHDSNSISEWNAMGHNGYSVTTSDWTTASFDAPGTRIPTRATASIHSVNPVAGSSSVADNIDGSGLIKGTKVLEGKGDIRCSYCHDLHDMNKAYGDTSSGTPLLRGSWLANPYPQEIPPEPVNWDYYTGNNWGQRDPSNNAVTFPRMYASSAGSAKAGGFFIDQNSGWPTRNPDNSYKSVAETAGLCTLCHGADVNNMDYYVGSNLWIGTNGHSNSTLDGTALNAVNIFDARRGATNPTDYHMLGQGIPTTLDSRYGKDSYGDFLPYGQRFRATQVAKDGYAPPLNTGWYGGTEGQRPRGTQYGTWYSATGIGNDGDTHAPDRAHNFSCSKCHTPHASGLPALLMTNCLDSGLSNWSATGRDGLNRNITLGPTSSNAYAKRVAGNCHRKESTSTGWNKMAPNQ